MWDQGSQQGLARLDVIRRDIEALNLRWLMLIKHVSRHSAVVAMDQFRIRRPLANLCMGSPRSVLADTSKLGIPLFGISEMGMFLVDLETVISTGSLPAPEEPEDPQVRRLADECRDLAYAYLSLVRELAGRDPVLAIMLLGIDERMLALASCSVDQLAHLARASSAILTARHSASLDSQLRINAPGQDSWRQRSVLSSWFLLVDDAPDRPMTKVVEPTLASDPLGQMLNVTGLVALGCRMKASVALTHARRPLVRHVMLAAGVPIEDKGGRKPSRIASLIETTSAHVASSFFLINYIRARARFGVYSAECTADAYLRALTMSRNAGAITDIDQDLALMISNSFHNEQITLARCGTCSSSYLATTAPIQIKNEVLRGDCPICREVQEMHSGQRVTKIDGRKRRLQEILESSAS